MVLHVALMSFKADADEAAIGELANMLAALPTKIDGITDYTWGVNVSVEGLDQGYTHGFVMTFESIAARDAYLPHPDHTAVIPYVTAVAEKVLIFDIER